jgi:hypothetical protein|tara:strand:- start:1592 stop:2521 length:930 start_codon:yes stop_codon:yes gene_type:complete
VELKDAEKFVMSVLGPAGPQVRALIPDLTGIVPGLQEAGGTLEEAVEEESVSKGLEGLLKTAAVPVLAAAEFNPATKNARRLGVGVDKNLLDGKLLKNYNEQDFNILNDLVNQGKASAGTKAANKLINAPIDQGREVGVRLNLNSKIIDAPENLKPKIQTVHDKNATGKALSYQPFVTVVSTKDKKVKFYVDPKGREQIAKGEKSKHPAMSVNGAYEPNLKILPTDDDVVEIGFNPKAHHLFIDLKTGQAVKEADAATVIGDRVYAKNVSYFKKSEAPVPEAKSDVRYQAKKSGGLVQSNPYSYDPRAI